MFFVMHCGGIPFNGDTIKTKSLGGSESAAYYMAREIVRRGHHVTLFTNTKEPGTFDGVKYESAGDISEECPLGNRFTFYAENNPHDVCLIQRSARAFDRKWASKINLLWMHDLALYRWKDEMIGQLWNIDKVLCVSGFHVEQVKQVYGFSDEILSVVHNGLEPALYGKREKFNDGKKHLFYSSRPERGLSNALTIMEAIQDKPVHLHVCGYDNTVPQMRQMYEALRRKCDELPNVTNHGALTKVELAELQGQCHAWLYPTEFEEVSCITAMEAMASGNLVIASNHAAIPDTCAGDEDTVLIPLKNGRADIGKFIEAVLNDNESADYRTPYTWERSATELLDVVAGIFGKARPQSLMHHYLRHSDIPAFERVMLDGESAFLREMRNEYDKGYAFYRNSTYAQHYADYYAYEKARGINYGPEDVTGTTRFQHIANIVRKLPEGATVLDYGCAHGHYTVPLAKMNPNLHFVGADLAQMNLDTAQKWAEDEGLTNASFVKADGSGANLGAFDFIIAAEVVEHVGRPQALVDTLAGQLKDGGRIVVTTPYGPWEAQGYREHGYWRAHLHHFERADLHDMFGHHPEYKIVAAPAGKSKWHTALGSYIFTFTKPVEPSRQIDYARKVRETMPDQTVSCCMIVKDSEQDIARCLNTVLPHVQEVVIGVDAATSDGTMDVLLKLREKNPLVAFDVFEIPKVLETGFAEARNATLARASCDWILWLDADEVLTQGWQISRLLRNNCYNGYAVNQHHFSSAPVGVMKVDKPCRLFRNFIGIKFFGEVHEHPEIKINEGLGPVSMMPGAEIVHMGYVDEGVRRGRFDRNLPLLKRDRAKNPDRLLGKFLWVRDLAQLSQYEEEAGCLNAAELPGRIAEGIKLWLEIVDSGNSRLMIDAFPYYSHLVGYKGGVHCTFAINAGYRGDESLRDASPVDGLFESTEHAEAMMRAILNDKLPKIERRYL